METKKPFYDCCPHITHWIVNCIVDTVNNITFVFIWTTSWAVMRGRLKITLSITRLGLSPSVHDHILFLKWSVFNNWEFNKVQTKLDHIWLYFLWKNTVQWFDDICAITWTQIGWWLWKEDLTMFSHTAMRQALWSSGDKREKFLSHQVFTKWSATHLEIHFIRAL